MPARSHPEAALVVDPDRAAALGAVAASVGRRPVEILNEVLDAYLELSPEDWAAIEEGERDAAAGRFATDDEVAALFAAR